MATQTKSGVFLREDPALGLVAYNPFSGLFYACNHKDRDALLLWLNKRTEKPPSPIYKKTLGIGWSIDDKEAEYPVPHLLPRPDDWTIVPGTYMPILVNWLITGNCPLHCRYCYAQDVMHGIYAEPKINNIEDIAKSIIKIDPLVVVLTGGDPLASLYLEEGIKLLHRKVGIIVDTCAYSLKPEHIRIFKKYGVFVRVSLDSEIPKINNYLRPVSGRSKRLEKKHRDSAEAALDAIIMCVDNGIKVAVQTVATKKNRSDFEALGNKLFKLGVSGWRILMIAASKGQMEQYKSLSGDKISQKRFYSHIAEQLMSKHRNVWHDKMSVQIASNEFPNAIILVAPDGTFLTESNLNRPEMGKIVIDSDYPKQPRLEHIHNYVDMHAHTARYLNMEVAFINPGGSND
jgi:MoaA/NifB/PqqE/SkfB family radical SAM enzyme